MSQTPTATWASRRFSTMLLPTSVGSRRAAGAALAWVALLLTALASGPDFAAAATYRIPVPIVGNCSVDVTSVLSSWISSVPDHSTLSFAPHACYRIEGTLVVRNRRALAFEGHGATFRSFDPPADQRAIWRVWQSTDLTFRDMTIRGSYADGGTLTADLQHAHGIDLRGSSAAIASVAIEDVAGDCVYFGLGSDGRTRSSGRFSHSSCSKTSRNAVSVTAGNRILVQHVTTSMIGYDAFDVEPNLAPGNWGSTDVTFRHNLIGSYYLEAYSLVENGPVSHQSFTDNRLVNAGLSIFVGPVGPVFARARQVTIARNISATARPSSVRLSDIDGLTVVDNHVPVAGEGSLSISRSCGVSILRNVPGAWTRIASSRRACRNSRQPITRGRALRR